MEDPAEGPSPLLTAGDVGQHLQVHPKTVYAWADRGLLPAVRLGRRAVRFRREDVERLIRDRLAGASS